jgi:uncharacterized protein YdeI (BOF family)
MKYLLLLFSIMLLTVACSGEKYGTGVDPEAALVTVKDVYMDQSLQGKIVNLEGEIISQCQSPDKCWYFMQDATGRIFVNLKPANFTLPAAIGRKAKVTGTVQGTRDGLQIIAQGVKVF